MPYVTCVTFYITVYNKAHGHIQPTWHTFTRYLNIQCWYNVPRPLTYRYTLF